MLYTVLVKPRLVKPYSSIIKERGLQTENKNELTEWHSGERLVYFTSFSSDGFTIATVVNRPDKKLLKPIYVQW